MIENYDIKKLVFKLNTPLRGYAANSKIAVKVDKDGTPLDRYWRDRLKDSKKDNCLEVVNKGDQ